MEESLLENYHAIVGSSLNFVLLVYLMQVRSSTTTNVHINPICIRLHQVIIQCSKCSLSFPLIDW